jgi:hypothetical protein
MLEFLRDQIWQFVGALLGLVALIVSLVIYYRQKQHKAFFYEIIANTSILSVSDEIRSHVQITYEGSPVEDVSYLLIRFSNTGNVPIVAADFDEAVTIRLLQHTHILSVEVIETTPKSLHAGVEVSQQNNTITLQPTLFNPGDSVTVKVLASQVKGRIEVTGRIVGVREIKAVTMRRSALGPNLLNATVSLGLGITISLTEMWLDIARERSPFALEELTFTILGGVLGGVVTFVLLSTLERIAVKQSYKRR